MVWQKQVNQGTSQETLVLPSFTGPTKPTFTAPGGLSVQIAEGDIKSQINTLGAQSGMGYLNDLAARKDVNWQPVKLAHWAYSARAKILVATIFSIALIGCSSIQTLDVRELFASEWGVFNVLPIERRVIKVPTVKWEAREDVGDYCKRILGGRTKLTPLACAVWEADKSRCTIITSPVTTHTILGHELRHCFEGDFHK